MNKLAVIRIRGKVKKTHTTKDTLGMLKLKNINNCTILDDSPQNKGMIKKVEGYVTWGELKEETLKKLLKQKGKSESKKLENEKLPFKLHPPAKGWERLGVKKSFKEGGSLGYRGEAINELIERMI